MLLFTYIYIYLYKLIIIYIYINGYILFKSKIFTDMNFHTLLPFKKYDKDIKPNMGHLSYSLFS